MLRAILTLTAALVCFSLIGLAQPVQPPEKKGDAIKGKDDAKSKSKGPTKAKPLDKGMESGKDGPKPTPLEPFKFPNEYDDWLEMRERIRALERQLKPDKKVPYSCRLTGKLDGDFVVFRAVFMFSTEGPRTTVILGLQGGHLLDEGDLDGQPPILEFTKEEGFVALVDKEAKPQKLTLNFRVPVQVKEAAAGAVKRGIDLSLPGTPVTIVNLELPTQVKELLWNETREKTKTPGRWQIGLEEKSKGLSLAWKEPVSIAGNPPLAKADGQIKVDVDDKDVHITAKLTLEDSRLQTKDWRLVIPAQATIEEVEAPAGLTYQLIKDEKSSFHLLKTSDATAERWQVTISMRVPRPNPPGRVAIGPFHVLDAVQHQGTISVKRKSEPSAGQRLVFLRYGETYQKSAESESVFRYVAPPATEKNWKSPLVQKAPLELEWRFEKNQVESQVEHTVKLTTVNQGWEIDAITIIKAKAIFSAFGALDLKLPPPRGFGLLGAAAPGLAFPGSLPWGGLWASAGTPGAFARADDFEVSEESGIPVKLIPQDATGKVRVVLDRIPPPTEVKLLVKNKVRVSAPHQRIRLELPRPIGTLERPGKLSVRSDDRTELLHGPEGADEPVPDHDRHELTWDQSPNHVDLAWRPFRREIRAEGTIDITVHDRTAQVKQTLLFPRSPGDAKNSQVALLAPHGIDKVTMLFGGEKTIHDARQPMWLRPPASEKVEVILFYDLPITAARSLELLTIWPTNVSQKDVKVRVWLPGGGRARVKDDLRGLWKERSIERVAGVDSFPSLVLQGFGPVLPLVLEIEAASTTQPAAFLADRALIQVQTLDDGSQQCRARYWIRKIHATSVDIELPLPLPRFREAPSVLIGGVKTNVERLDPNEGTVRVSLQREQVALPAILEVNYIIPGEAMETTSWWRTTLHAPVFVSDVVIGQTRWQLTASRPMIAASLGQNVVPDVEWSWLHWLPTPQPSVDSADLEGWLTAKEPTAPATAITYSITHNRAQPETVYHLPRQGWLIGCSGLFLILILGGYLAPLPRTGYLLLLLGAAMSILALILLCPAAVHAVLFGIQPGIVLAVIFIGIHWWLQERYRRQLVFLPGFSRAKPGSTLARSNAANRPREASTIDAPEPLEDPTASKTTGSSS